MKPLEYFLDLTLIPRPSGKEEKVRDYLVDFAKKHNLEYLVNDNKCVIIKKHNNSKETVILQAHTDMVCEKLKGVEIDFDKEPISTIIEGDFIKAKGTTLGADDGYGVAIILNILETCGEGYPNLECIFTSDEEVGMTGAMSLDLTDMKAKKIIGLDGTSSSEITVSCAGSQRIEYQKTYNEADVSLKGYSLQVSGLLGGHSGEEINLNRANAIKMIGEFLIRLKDVKISKFIGGNKDNAIPREANCEFVCDSNKEFVLNVLNNFIEEQKIKYPKEEALNVTLEEIEINKIENNNKSFRLISFINEFMNGVLVYDKEIENFPITSINLAKITMENGKIIIRSMLRSSDKELEEKYTKKFENLGKKYDYTVLLGDKSPYFERSKDNTLENICVQSYKELGYGELKVSGIHAGLEGGVFAEKIPNSQIVCLGADLYYIHTPNEMMKISSLEKLEIWVKQILKNLAK